LQPEEEVEVPFLAVNYVLPGHYFPRITNISYDKISTFHFFFWSFLGLKCEPKNFLIPLPSPPILSKPAAATYFQQLSMAETRLMSVYRTTNTVFDTPIKYPFISITSKPIKVVFSTSFPSWVSLKTSKFSTFNIIPLVAQTSDWAQQDEENTVTLGEESFGDGSEETFPEPPEEAKLYVGNLPYDVNSDNLAQLFDQAGTVEVAEV